MGNDIRFLYTVVEMLAARDEHVSLDCSIKVVQEQRVDRIRVLVQVENYRQRGFAGIETLLADLVACGESATGAPFCILHDHLDWRRDIDLEICVPVRRWAHLPANVQSRRVPGSTVMSVKLPPFARDALTQAKEALAALETSVVENNRICAGDVREIYPWRQTAGIEMQIPII